MAVGFFLGEIGVGPDKGGITHQPVSRRDPVDEHDHKVDVGDVLEVTGHQVQPVVDAPQTMHVDPDRSGHVECIIGHLHNFIGHSTLGTHHVLRPVRRDGDEL